MERKLPVITIEGTDFIVDVENMLLRELERKPNSISIFHMKEVEGGYQFIYDKLERNISIWSTASEMHVVVDIPELVKLDPVGMSDKYGVPIGELGTKTDFELMVDQEALKRRLGGELPTIEILGDIFFVDIENDRFRPVGDAQSDGISITELEQYYNGEKEAYVIPYNRETRTVEKLSDDEISSIPVSMVAVRIPFELQLDPIGFHRRWYGKEESQFLKEYNVRLQFKAEVLSWEELGFKQQQKPAIKQDENPAEKQKKRGRRL
ncbi:MAG: hypothetical protein DCE86_00170 [Flavobacteriaceae bacterium]|nr:MAG: hypothetical protein DCE86_00170 [Flavobacteriaceae bacterium]